MFALIQIHLMSIRDCKQSFGGLYLNKYDAVSVVFLIYIDTDIESFTVFKLIELIASSSVFYFLFIFFLWQIK